MLNFRCHILKLAALLSLNDNFVGLLLATSTLSELVWPSDVVESFCLSYHLQIPLLRKATPRDGA